MNWEKRFKEAIDDKKIKDKKALQKAAQESDKKRNCYSNLQFDRKEEVKKYFVDVIEAFANAFKVVIFKGLDSHYSGGIWFKKITVTESWEISIPAVLLGFRFCFSSDLTIFVSATERWPKREQSDNSPGWPFIGICHLSMNDPLAKEKLAEALIDWFNKNYRG